MAAKAATAKKTPAKKAPAKKPAAKRAPAKPKAEPKPDPKPETPVDAPVEETAPVEEAPEAEGPTEHDHAPEEPARLPTDVHVREPKKGDLVVVEPLLKDGKVYPVGSAAPDLTDAEVERLTRLGVVE